LEKILPPLRRLGCVGFDSDTIDLGGRSPPLVIHQTKKNHTKTKTPKPHPTKKRGKTPKGGRRYIAGHGPRTRIRNTPTKKTCRDKHCKTMDTSAGGNKMKGARGRKGRAHS